MTLDRPEGLISSPPHLLRAAPQLPCRKAGAFGQSGELGPHDGGVDLASGREARKAAIGAGDNPLAPNDPREPPDALRDRLGMLDEFEP